MKKIFNPAAAFLLICITSILQAQQNNKVIDIGSGRELFVDHFLIESLDKTNLRLHTPVRAGCVLRFDRPWEGRYCGYVTVIQDKNSVSKNSKYKMYYRGLPESGKDGSDREVTCYAESPDGIKWIKPCLKLYKIKGTYNNNVILCNMAPFSHNFCPFADTRPGTPSSERFKAVAGISKSNLAGFVSPDGIHWKKIRSSPIITHKDFAFDSQNVCFWSEFEKCYVCYFRTWAHNVRTISRTTSKDFLNWTESVEMKFGNTPMENLYTNQTKPYFRAPQVYISIAARFMPGRRVISQSEFQKIGGEASYSGDCSDAVFMTSRGGDLYDRTFMESFIRPGIGSGNWTSRTNYPAYGIVKTSPCEMSFYLQRHSGQPSHFLERLTMRLDGFVSVNAGYNGGEMITKPFCFRGSKLSINFSTSAPGEIRVEIQDRSGKPIGGYRLQDSDLLIGDSIERAVTWRGRTDVGGLSGKPVKLRFVMKDCDLFSICFRKDS